MTYEVGHGEVHPVLCLRACFPLAYPPFGCHQLATPFVGRLAQTGEIVTDVASCGGGIASLRVAGTAAAAGAGPGLPCVKIRAVNSAHHRRVVLIR